MKKNIWITILLIVVLSSCQAIESESHQAESISVGEQVVEITFTSLQSTYEITTPLSLALEIENQSNQNIYLPWGTNPGFNVIIVDLDSTFRTMFVLDMPPLKEEYQQYPSILPGERARSDLGIPTQLTAGHYNICAEILVLGESGSNHEQPKVCVQIFFK